MAKFVNCYCYCNWYWFIFATSHRGAKCKFGWDYTHRT